MYFTPLYYTMSHFCKYIRPGAQRIGFGNSDENLMVTAAKNPDGGIAVVVLKQEDQAKSFKLMLGDVERSISISPKALQTIIIE